MESNGVKGLRVEGLVACHSRCTNGGIGGIPGIEPGHRMYLPRDDPGSWRWSSAGSGSPEASDWAQIAPGARTGMAIAAQAWTCPIGGLGTVVTHE